MHLRPMTMIKHPAFEQLSAAMFLPDTQLLSPVSHPRHSSLLLQIPPLASQNRISNPTRH